MARPQPSYRSDSDRLDAIEAMVAEVLAILRERRAASPDERYGRLLAALESSMGGCDLLPFRAEEVIQHAEEDFALSEALKACQIRNADSLGSTFRELKGRELNGLRLIRRGRLWELERT